MCLNVVCEVEGGLRYWSGIEWWMMQCPYVILKTFRARSVCMTAPWNISLSPPPLLIPPCVLSAPGLWNVEPFFAVATSSVSLLTHFFLLFAFFKSTCYQQHFVYFCCLFAHISCTINTYAHTERHRVLHLHHIWLWQGHVKFILIRGSGQAGLQMEIEFGVTGSRRGSGSSI